MNESDIRESKEGCAKKSDCNERSPVMQLSKSANSHTPLATPSVLKKAMPGWGGVRYTELNFIFFSTRTI